MKLVIKNTEEKLKLTASDVDLKITGSENKLKFRIGAPVLPTGFTYTFPYMLS